MPPNGWRMIAVSDPYMHTHTPEFVAVQRRRIWLHAGGRHLYMAPEEWIRPQALGMWGM